MASVQLDASSVAEGSLLALSGAVLLSCVAALALSPCSELLVGSGLLVAAAWVMPAGPTRGAAFALCLLGLLAWTTWRRVDYLVARNGLLEMNSGLGTAARPRELPFFIAFPIALGLQVLFRPEVFLDSSLESVLRWLLPPILVALAGSLLARRYQLSGVLLAGACAVALGAGWRLPGSLAFLAVATGDLALAHRPRKNTEDGVARTRPLVHGWGTATPAVAVVALAAVDLMRGGAAGDTLVILLALALTFCAPPWREPALHLSWARFGTAVGLLLAAALAFELSPADPARSWQGVLKALAWVPLLLPAIAWSGRRWSPGLFWIPYALLTAVTLRWAPGLGALAAPLCLIILGLSSFKAWGGDSAGRATSNHNPWGSGQTLWALLWTGGAALAAGYPWLRDQPLETFLQLLGLSPSWPHAVVVVMAVAALTWVNSRNRLFSPSGSALDRAPWAALMVFGGLLALLVVNPPQGRETLRPEAKTLTAQRPRLVVDVEPQAASRLIVDSNLAYAVELEKGRPIATLRLHHTDGRVTEWALRAGEHTAEWAASRPDIAARGDFSAPPPWQSTVAPEGGYFAHRFRSRWEVESTEPVIRVVVIRRPRLPKDVLLTVYRLELVP
ncbi:MAG: hypothetical protein K0U98_09255 [Deltaproteobacteria bacterium]|nr:hypothetical protein [Deltaproteobacteria bacterium]